VPIRIAAQVHLQRFYGELGFRRASADYDDAGIQHVEMLLDPPGCGSSSVTSPGG
jgi:ElaA protein